jgi:hypothetical protein
MSKNMSTNTLQYSPEEFASKGTQLYREQILPKIDRAADGKIVAIDIETGEFELADTTLAAAAKCSTDCQMLNYGLNGLVPKVCINLIQYAQLIYNNVWTSQSK